MKINETILSIPPYLSTTWAHVRMLRMDGDLLIVSLSDGFQAKVPGLSREQIEMIFSFHQKALDAKEQTKEKASSAPFPEGFAKEAEQAIRFGMMGMESLGNAMQHNFAMRNSPLLPPEILSKVEAVSKAIAPEMKVDLPKAEPHCNCPHCQIARAIQRGLGAQPDVTPHQVEEEEVAAEELVFQEWRIEQTGEQLYSVINRIDGNERYSVYLGDPVGCTCGKSGCEHVLAVLRS
ncbi:hypothetical protein [Estrella lausannensis]|uniref:SWIM-type domain-containing protein n=1 Tax=Estrella lausannensis TaxID=483423 RepID=A0A0H5E7B5_9BACT|nr:hypothetical protein [Estrella lausannensis]CRX39220.1 Conserved hypothetical protein [Estrella lausannensis]